MCSPKLAQLSANAQVQTWRWMQCPAGTSSLCLACMQGFQQQDSHELLRVLLDGLQTEEAKAITAKLKHAPRQQVSPRRLLHMRQTYRPHTACWSVYSNVSLVLSLLCMLGHLCRCALVTPPRSAPYPCKLRYSMTALIQGMSPAVRIDSSASIISHWTLAHGEPHAGVLSITHD